MTRDELLAALIAERQDHRWFKTPPKTASNLPVKRDDDVTTARRRRSLLDEDMTSGQWVTRRGVQVWEVAS